MGRAVGGGAARKTLVEVGFAFGRGRGWGLALVIVGTLLSGCVSVPLDAPPAPPPTDAQPAPAIASPVPGGMPAADEAPVGAPIVRARSRWVPVAWSQLAGFDADALHEAWNAWLKSCEKPPAAMAALCPQVRRLSIADEPARREWMRAVLQPYRVQPVDASDEPGLLTAYYEPLFEARRVAAPAYAVPLYAPPAGLGQRRPWYSRQEMDTLPQAQASLRGREIAWLADPLDALLLQIQGSGRLRVTEPDGSTRLVRVAYAGHNEHPYRSVGGWLLQQGALRDASWPGIRAWARANPQRVQEMLWTNPRVVFFREEPLDDFDAAFGPRGAQGVALTPGRSIAVDRDSIPYGTPVWLDSPGPQMPLRRLVLAQDTGGAITGAVRADWFVGWGPEAGEVAGRMRQSLRMWVLWPRGVAP